MKMLRRGTILPLTLTMAALIFILGWAMAGAADRGLNDARRQTWRVNAQAAARSGLELALAKLAADPGYSGDSRPALLAEGPENFQCEVFRENQISPSGQVVPPGYLYVQSTGHAPGGARSQACAMVNIQSGAGGVPGLPGIFGTSVSLDSSCLCDSYSSQNGQLTGHALIVTNSATPGAIQLMASANVRGTVMVGPDGAVETTIVRDPQASFTQAQRMRRPMDLNDVLLPAPPGDQDLVVDASADHVPPGNYRRLTITGSAHVALASGIYVVRELIVEGGSQVDIPGPTATQVYVTDQMLVSGGSQLSTPSQNTRRLQIYMAADSVFRQSEGSSVAGIVYGPAATMEFSGQSSLFGSVVGSAVSFTQDSRAIYDEDLKSFAVVLDPSPPSLRVVFREYR